VEWALSFQAARLWIGWTDATDGQEISSPASLLDCPGYGRIALVYLGCELIDSDPEIRWVEVHSGPLSRGGVC
jgi:hypothetical protein